MESEAKPKRRITSKRPPPSAPKQEVEAPKQFESSIDPKKKEIIEEVYFDDLTGYRSIRDTWKQAREIDPDIKLQDVSQWKAELEPCPSSKRPPCRRYLTNGVFAPCLICPSYNTALPCFQPLS